MATQGWWMRLLKHLPDAWDQPVTGLFFLTASDGEFPKLFVQALMANGYRPIPCRVRRSRRSSTSRSSARWWPCVPGLRMWCWRRTTATAWLTSAADRWLACGSGGVRGVHERQLA